MTVYNFDELNKLLPSLRTVTNTGPVVIPEAISDDDQVAIAAMHRDDPRAALVWADDTSEWTDKHGHVDESRPDFALFRSVLRVYGVDAQRAHRMLWQSPRAKTRADRWGEPRNGHVDFLDYELQRVADRWSQDEIQNATPYRSDDPTTWPELGAPHGSCARCDRFSQENRALRRQVELVNELIKSDLSPVFKLTLLRLVAIVGYYQGRGTTTFQTSAKKIGESIGLSAQSVRTVLHALARNDRDELQNEHGLIDLDTTRVPEAGEFCSVFDITPLTSGGYTGFLEAVVAYAPELPARPKRAPRQKQEEIKPPPEVVQIRDCPGTGQAHPAHSRNVVCGGCGDDLIEEVRYAQNATPYRSEKGRSLWDTSGATPHRFEPRTIDGEDLERLNAIYDRAGEAVGNHSPAQRFCHSCGAPDDPVYGRVGQVGSIWLHTGLDAPCQMVEAVAS